MGKEIDLNKGELSRHVNKALKAISDGFVIAIPLEYSYAFACDAFRRDAVRAMHVLRGDPLFTVAQVLVGSAKSPRVVLKYSPRLAHCENLWPGMLSMNLRPGTDWDLGDANQLDECRFVFLKINLQRRYWQREVHLQLESRPS